MFDMKKPCRDCPFKRDNGEKYQLSERRIVGIFNATAFQCHKTLDSKPQQCAGLESILHKEKTPNQIMQTAESLIGFDFATIDGSETYDTMYEAVEAHRVKTAP